MKQFFNEQKKLGFGMMRLPMVGGDVNYDEVSRMVDEFLAAGFNYFDTAHGYLGGLSEVAVGRCLSARHERSEFLLTDKLTEPYFKREEDIRPFFESQLATCGVDYFDFYLMHAQSKSIFAHFKRCHAYETAFALKAEGKIKHVGLSFHDKAEVLEEILCTYPQVELVQIQLNYLDYEDAAVQSRLCLEVCRRHGKPVVIMEPIKGGSLVNLTPDVLAEVQKAGFDPAELALRFAATPDDVMMVLSGMSSEAQMQANISYMRDFVPLNEQEWALSQRLADVIRSKNAIACTACRYCVEGCPMHISIPDLFACMNSKMLFHNWNADYYYHSVHTAHNGKASQCIRCGKCEHICPQHLPIRDLLATVAKEFEH